MFNRIRLLLYLQSLYIEFICENFDFAIVDKPEFESRVTTVIAT